MNESQKLTLFQSANVSVLIASDFAGYLENGQSFILDALKEAGLSAKEAVVFFTAMGEKETGAAEAYLHCFSILDLEKDFDAWSDQDKNFEASKHEILDALQDSMTQGHGLQ